MTGQLLISVATIGGIVAVLVDYVRWLGVNPQAMEMEK